MVIRYFNLPRSMARKSVTIGLNQSLIQINPCSPNTPSPLFSYFPVTSEFKILFLGV
jgi:hypothetical protein